MKSEVKLDATSTTCTYPMLKIDPDDGEVVMFLSEKECVTLNVGTCRNTHIGNYREDTTTSRFTPFYGTLALSN